MKYAGAMFAKLFGDIPAEVLEFLDTERAKVYVALTSGNPGLLRLVCDALSQLDVKAIICSTLHEFSDPSNPDMLIVKHLPSHKVMPLVDMAIIHGGQGSVQTAIESGTPIIGIPLHAEQGLNVGIVEGNGAGIMQNKHQLSSDAIQHAVTRILKDPSYKENMQRLSAHQKTVDGVKRVADILMEIDLQRSGASS